MRILDKLMAEHIPLPGCPDIIVTRAYAWQYLLDLGFDPCENGAMDYMVFVPAAVPLELTPEDERDRMVEDIMQVELSRN